MTTLDKIKLIDFYLHGVDMNVSYQGDYGLKSYKTDYKEGGSTIRHSLYYHTSLDALRPVIVKLMNINHKQLSGGYLNNLLWLQIKIKDILSNLFTSEDAKISDLFYSVVECIKYLNEKEK